MGGNLKHAGFAAASVALVFLICLILDAGMVTFELHRLSAGAGRIGWVSAAFQWWLLIVLTSVIPSAVLHMFKIPRPAAYVLAGTLSGWVAVYSFWFEFGETFSLGWLTPTTFKARAFSEVFGEALTGFNLKILWGYWDSWVGWSVPAGCLIGALCAWLYWFFVMRRVLRRDKVPASE